MVLLIQLPQTVCDRFLLQWPALTFNALHCRCCHMDSIQKARSNTNNVSNIIPAWNEVVVIDPPILATARVAIAIA